MTALPDLVTHTYDPRRGPLRNLCDLPVPLAVALLAEIAAEGRRRLKPDYLARRQATEAWLLAERTRLLGPPPRRHPLYFFLGDFDDGLDPARPAALVLPLARFAPDSLTFTLPDSMASHAIATDPAAAAIRRAHHGRVFTLEDIARLVAAEGLPRRAPGAALADGFIEMQLWDDAAIRPLVGAGAAGWEERRGCGG
jgi:hypothetical protein